MRTAALRRLLDLLLATVRSAVRELEPGDELPDPLHEPSVSALALEGGSRGIRDWLNSARSLTLGAIDAAFSTAGLARPAVDLIVTLTAVLEDWGGDAAVAGNARQRCHHVAIAGGPRPSRADPVRAG
ncbi:hypothetical protein [Kitasatospora sp. NPDC056531]|uniref:hypothetical protein n=1 Tax=Kitasatospora sp. NPDC056531 TaxID=3345856 RepID=UPI0036956AA4